MSAPTGWMTQFRDADGRWWFSGGADSVWGGKLIGTEGKEEEIVGGRFIAYGSSVEMLESAPDGIHLCRVTFTGTGADVGSERIRTVSLAEAEQIAAAMQH